MDKILKVYLGTTYVGNLIEKNGKTMKFVYHSVLSPIISLSMPTSKLIYNNNQAYPFFENLLPEGDVLQQIAKSKGVSANNAFSLLSVIGEDCAGAISLHTGELKVDDEIPRELSKEEFANIVSENLESRFTYQSDTRLSLAGAQDKTTIIVKNNKYYVPTFSFPSTHIIKFDNKRFKNILLNELFCTNLARSLDLPTSIIDINYIVENTFLQIERFDRKKENGRIVRVHQEDFCQLLAVRSRNKYQKEGGPSFLQSAQLINENSLNKARDLVYLAKILVFNYLVGNCDYHGKNLSFLHTTQSLTPFYDLVSTIVYPTLTTDIAMAINKKYSINKITKDDIIKEFDKWGIKGTQTLALITKDFKHIVSIANEIKNEDCYRSATKEIAEITNFIEKQFNKIK